VGSRNRELDGVQVPHEKGQFWEFERGWAAHCKVQGHSVVSCAKRQNRSRCRLGCGGRELRKNGWTDRNAVWVVESDGPKEACVTMGARWRHMANTTEPSLCCGDAALYQIRSTLTVVYPWLRSQKWGMLLFTYSNLFSEVCSESRSRHDMKLKSFVVYMTVSKAIASFATKVEL